MIPIQLQLSGFLSYLDPVKLDFTSFSIACITGSNGAGKSSLLDAITWALFGQGRRKDDAMINSRAKACEVIFDFEYEGNLYRIQRSKPRDKTGLLEFYLCGANGAWRPLTEKTMRDTDARIQSTLRMDYETFTNASFFLQGKADQFAQQRPGDRKRVLSSILGLEVWEEYRTDAAERRKLIEGEIKVMDGQLAEIEGELGQEIPRREKLKQAEDSLEQVKVLCQAKEDGLVSLQRLASSLEEQKRLVDVLARGVNEGRIRFDRQRSQLKDLRTEQASFHLVISEEDEVTAGYQRLKEYRSELSRWEETAANFREIEKRRAEPLTGIAAEASRLQQERKTLLEQEKVIQQDETRLVDLRLQIQEGASQLKALEETLASRKDLEVHLQELQQRVADARSGNVALKEGMNALKERISRLKNTEGATCPLCGQPLSAAERANLVESLGLEGKDMGDRYRANVDLLAQAESLTRESQAKITNLAKVEDEFRSVSRQHARLEADQARIEQNIQSWEQDGSTRGVGRLAQVSRMLVENDFAHEARAKLAVIDAESKALGYDSAAHDAVREAELEARSFEEAMRKLEAARASLAPLERQIAGLEAQITTEGSTLTTQEEAYRQALTKYEREAAQLPDINQAEREVMDLRSESNRLRTDVGMLRQQVAILETQRERKVRLGAKREDLSVKVTRLKSLERAFGKDGVPALLIEQALPEIEDQANDILDRLSAGKMSVNFETQKLYKDKSRDDRKETLDILISDEAGVREYELFSGGEAFRVNFSIRLALSRVLAQRAGARLQTLVIDEGFGSQDAEGRQRLIEAINQVRPEFAKILVITHLEELKEIFPARIEVEKGLSGSQVRVVT